MKKVVVICLMLFLVVGICACEDTPNNVSVVFYYPRVSYLYDNASGVIGNEVTDLHRNDLSIEEILQRYLSGPNDKDLHSPLSHHVSLKRVDFEDDALIITLGDSIADLAPTGLTSSLAALALTCFEISDVNEVRVRGESVLIDGEQAVVFTKDNVMLWDSYVVNPPAVQTTEQGE